MENRVVRDLLTGRLELYPTGIECALIYYDTEFKFDMSYFVIPETWEEERGVSVEVYKMTDIETILDHYLGIRESGYHTYSRFYVINNNKCDLYIAGFNLLGYQGMIDSEEDYDHRLNFSLLRLRYHKKMMMYAMDRFSYEEPSFIEEIIELDRDNCYNYVDIDTLSVVAEVRGYEVLGSNNWECKNEGCTECLGN